MTAPVIDPVPAVGRRATALMNLRAALTPGDRIWCVRRRESRTGSSETVGFFRVTDDRSIVPISLDVAMVSGRVFDQVIDGVIFRNADPVIVIRAISAALFDDTDALGVEWL